MGVQDAEDESQSKVIINSYSNFRCADMDVNQETQIVIPRDSTMSHSPVPNLLPNDSMHQMFDQDIDIPGVDAQDIDTRDFDVRDTNVQNDDIQHDESQQTEQIHPSHNPINTITIELIDLDFSNEVKGAEGQICASQEVLDVIIKRYTHITSNAFRGGANVTDESFMACGLNSGCINRELSIECPEEGCPCDPFCQNKKFQQRRYASLQIFKTRMKGFGLRTKSNIKRKGNISRFVNHSCSPNCVLEKWVVGKQMRVGLFAKKDISIGTELTFDYKFERYGSKAQICYCREPNCTGSIGKEKNGNPILSIQELDGLSDDDEDEVLNESKPIISLGKALSSIDHVKDIVKYLMLHVSSPTKILRVLNRLLKTDTQSLLRKFIHYRGVYLLERCLTTHINSKTIVRYNVLLALKMLPISSRNAIVTLEPLIEEMSNVNEYGDETAELAQSVLDGWVGLEIVYKIPKRTKSAEDVEKDELDQKYEDNLPSWDIDNTMDRHDRSSSFKESPRYEHQTPETGYITHRMQEVESKDQLIELPAALAWNTITLRQQVAPHTPILDRTPGSDTSIITPNFFEGISESSIQQMVEAAHEATRISSEQAKKRIIDEEEDERKKKTKMAERKLKHKELLRSVAAKSRAKTEKIKEQEKTLAKVSTDKFSNEVDMKYIIKEKLSLITINVMSRYKDQMSSELFKDRAKQALFFDKITKGLLEKQIRKYKEQKRKIPGEIGENSVKAAKKYVKDYLARHDINVDKLT